MAKNIAGVYDLSDFTGKKKKNTEQKSTGIAGKYDLNSFMDQDSPLENARLIDTAPRQYLLTGDELIDKRNALRVSEGLNPSYTTAEQKRNQLRLEQGLTPSRNLTRETNEALSALDTRIGEIDTELDSIAAQSAASANTSPYYMPETQADADNAFKAESLKKERQQKEAAKRFALENSDYTDILARGDKNLFEELYNLTYDVRTGRIDVDQASTGADQNDSLAARQRGTEYAQKTARIDEIRNTLAQKGYDVNRYYTAYENSRNTEEAKELENTMAEFAREHPVAATVGSVLTAPVRGAAAAMGMLVDNSRNSPYQGLNTLSKGVQTGANERITEDLTAWAKEKGWSDKSAQYLSKAGNMAYNAITSSLESVLTMTAGGPFGEVLMSLNAATQTFNDGMEKGLDKRHALVSAIGAGIFEAAFEHISLEKLRFMKTSDKRGIATSLLNVLKQFGTEGMEEVSTDVANGLADYLYNGGLSDFEMNVREYMDAGMEEPEARKQAAKDFGLQLGETFIVGGLSGAMMAGQVQAQRDIGLAAAERSAGKAVKTLAGQTEGGLKEVLAPLTGENSRALNDLTEKTGARKTGRVVAEALQEATENVAKTQAENARKTNVDTLADAIVESKQGNYTRETAQKVAQAYIDLIGKKSKNVNDLMTVATNEKAVDVLNEVLTGGKYNALESLRSAIIDTAEKNRLSTKVLDKLERWANKDAIQKAQKTQDVVENGSEALKTDSAEKLDAVTKNINETAVRTAEGTGRVTKITGVVDGDLEVQVDESGATELLKNINFGDTTEGLKNQATYTQLRDMMTGTAEYKTPLTVEAANMALALAQNSGKSQTSVLNQFYSAYAAGAVLGDENKLRQNLAINEEYNLSDSVIDLAYNAGVKQFKPTPGVTNISRAPLSAAQRVELAALNDWAQKNDKRIIAFTEMYGQTDEVDGRVAKYRLYGEQAGDAIYVALKANGQSNIISAAAMHETHHWIGTVDKKAQLALTGMVIDYLKNKSGLDYKAIYEQRARIYKGETQAFIEEEIASQFLGTLWADKGFQKEVAKNKTLAQKIVDGLREFLDKIHDLLWEQAKRENDLAMKAALQADEAEARQMLKNFEGVIAHTLEMERKQKAERTETEKETSAAEETVIEDSANLIRQSLALAQSGEHAKLLDKEWTDEAALPKSTVTERYDKIVELWKKIGNEIHSEFLTAWDKKVGKDRAFDIFKAQSGYKYNAELASMCKKGIALFDAIDVIVKERVLDELKIEELGKHEKEILYDILKDHGHEIPCAICYVEQARQREGAIISDFVNGNKAKKKLGWNEALSKIEEKMEAQGVNYTFGVMDIANADYAPSDAVMTAKEQDAFYKAVYELVNEEITDANKNAKTKRALAKAATPEAITNALKGSITLNMRVYKALVGEMQSRYRLPKYALYSSVATQNIAKANHELYKTFNMQGGVSGYKTKQTPVVYWGDILRMGAKPESVRKAGGIRWQSNSDFQMYTFLDRVQYFVDMTAKGYYHQEYTKVPAALKLFGLMGGKQNASLIPAVHIYKNADGSVNEERTRENAGLDENGEPIYDKVEGIDQEEAFLLSTDREYSRNVGPIVVGYSDNHIRKLLDDARISMIIGFHDKTNDPAKRYRGARYAHNYNGENEAKNGKGETIHVDFSKYLIKAEKRFTKTDNAFAGTTTFDGRTYTADEIPRLAADMYRAEIKAKGWTPAYQKFADHENYYKLLADFRLVDSEGHYAPQGKVRFFIPETVPVRTVDKNGNARVTRMDTTEYIKTELEKELRERDAIARDLADESADGIIPQFREAITAERGTRESRALDDEYMALDEEYMAAVEAGNMDQMAKLVREAARLADYDSPLLYHGSGAFGFTEFDLRRGEGLIFASSNRKVSETYIAGNIRRSRIGKINKKINPEEMHGEELLQYAKDIMPDEYNDFRLMSNDEKNSKILKAKNDLATAMDIAIDYWNKSSKRIKSAYKEEFDEYVDIITELSDANNKEEIRRAWKKYQEYQDQYLWYTDEYDDEEIEKFWLGLDQKTGGEVRGGAIELNNLLTREDVYVVDLGDGDQRYSDEGSIKIDLLTTMHSGVYELYGRLGNCLKIEADGAWWNRIKAPEELHLNGPQTTRQIAQRAFDMGYDSVLIKNLRDNGGRQSYYGLGDIYIFNNESAVKSADPVTYDDDGNVIPLSERFNPESKDIRESRVLNSNAIEYVDRLKGGSRQRWEMMDVLEELAEKRAGAEVNRATLMKAARILAHGNENAANLRVITDRLENAAAMLQSGTNVDTVLYGLYKMAEDELTHAGEWDLQTWVKEFRQEFRDGKKMVRIFIPENVRTDLTENYGGPAGFRRAMFGKFIPVYDDVHNADYSLDRFYETLQDRNKYELPDTEDPGTKLNNLLKLYNADEYVMLQKGLGLEGETLAEAATDEAFKVLGVLLKADTRQYKNVNGKMELLQAEVEEDRERRLRMDRLQREIEDRRREGIQEHITNADVELNRQLKQLSESGKDSVAIEIERERLKNEYRLKALRDAYLQRAENMEQQYRDRQQIEAYRGDIKRDLKALTDRFINEKDSNNVPQALKETVLEFLNMFGQDRSLITVNAMHRLLEFADELKETDDGVMPAGYENLFGQFDEDIRSDLRDLTGKINSRETANGRRVYTSQLTLDEMKVLANTAAHIRHLVEGANEAWVNDRNVKMSDLGDRFKEQAKNVPKNPIKRLVANTLANDFLTTKMLTPIYFFDEKIGGVMKEIYEGFRDGQDKWYMRSAAAKDVVSKAKEKYKYDEWKKNTEHFTFGATQLRDVWDVDLPIEAMLQIYATIRREQESGHETMHLLEGGIVLGDELKAGNKLKDKLAGLKEKGLREKMDKIVQNAEEESNATRHMLNYEEVMQIIDRLTPEQKAYADEIVKYMSTEVARQGNEATMQLSGIRKFGEKYYFPFQSAKNYLYTRLGVSDDTRLKNAGFTKRVQHGANTPLVLSGFTDVAANHMQQMALFSSMTVPIDTLNRFINYQPMTIDEEGNAVKDKDNIKTLLSNAYGKSAMDYINRFITQVNGGIRKDNLDNIWNKGTSLFKRSAVMGNLSVVVQQPTALMRAMAMVNPQYFLGTARLSDYKDMIEHAPIAGVKEMGGFDTMTGRGAAEWIVDEQTAGQRMTELWGKGAEIADAVTWTNIWNAVKRETRAKHKDVEYGSDRFYELAYKRFRDVIDYTQVYDSTLSKSELMRGEGALTKMVTAFMAEPTLSYNLLTQSGLKNRSINKGRALAAFAANIIVNGMLKSIVGAWRDKDEDESYWEKWLKRVTGDVVGSKDVFFLDGAWSPFGMIPWVKDLISIWQGYDVDRADISVVQDVIEGLEDFFGWIKDYDGSFDWEDADEIRKIAGIISMVSPTPLQKILQDVEGIARTFRQSVDRPMETTFMTARNAVLEGLGFDKGKAEAAYDAVVKNDTEYIRRNTQDKNAQKKFDKNVVDGLVDKDKRITAAAEAEYMQQFDRYETLVDDITADGFTRDQVIKAIERLYDAMDTDEEKETGTPKAKTLYRKANLDRALKSGNARAYWDVGNRMLAAGQEDEKTLISEAKSYAKNLYFDTVDSSRTYVYLTDFAKMTPGEADKQIEFWNYNVMHEDSNVNQSQFEKYGETGLEDKGITLEQYAELMNVRNNTKGDDLDGDGRTDSGSAKKKVLAYIDGLDISDAQKDAMYDACNYGATQLKDAPWH